MYNKAKTPARKLNTNKGVTFTMGPIHFNQFNAFSKYGINALRIFQYCIIVQGLKRKQKKTEDEFIKIDNSNLYKWFGVHQPKKWTTLKKLHNAGLIELRKQGRGRAPLVKILVKKVH